MWPLTFQKKMISSLPSLFCLFSTPPPHAAIIPSFSQSCFYSSPLVKGSYFCTVSRLLVFPSFHSIWTTFIFQLPDNNSSNNEVAWKRAISLSFLKDILLPFRKQTFCRTVLLTDYQRVGNMIKRYEFYSSDDSLKFCVFSTHLGSDWKLARICTWLSKHLPRLKLFSINIMINN